MQNNQLQPKENKMGTMPIPRLLISMALPMILSMLVQALYNIVDSIFVARASQDALTALSLAFPVQSLMIALGAGTGVGINALLSRSLGEKRFDEANKTAENGIFLAACSYVVFLIFGLFFTRIFFESQTDIAPILDSGIDYLSICTIFSFGLFGQFVFERLLQSTGRTFHTMLTQGMGAIINIILDPIFIFGYLGLPAMGAAGAAIATVIGQVCAMLLAIYFNLKKNHDIQLRLKGFRPSLTTIKRIYAIGLPSIIMQSIGSVMVLGMNTILMSFTDVAARIFGIYFKLQSFIFMPVFGLNNGMVPIISYNYGARHRERILKTIRLSVAFAVSMMLIGFLVFQFFPDTLLALFEATPDAYEIGKTALRIISFHFLFAGFCIIFGSVFQALCNGVYSLVVSVGRQLVVLLPAAYLLSLTGNVNMVWWAFPIAELMSLALSVFFIITIYRKKIKPLPL